MIGGIDLGGTKIEARLFDSDMTEIARNRVPTPVQSYRAMLDGLLEQVAWLDQHAPGCPIGIGSPGLINPQTGIMLTANLPATGHPLAADLSRRFGRSLTVVNDCRAFALSEAIHGAGRGYHNVAGLVIGTGVAGGHVIGGTVLADLNGQHGEYGHLSLSAESVARHDLPLLKCGCGLTGCIETYLAGPGLARIARMKTGEDHSTRSIVSDPDMAGIVDIWVDLAADLVALITRTIDPDVIVLGGGLGSLPDLPAWIASKLSSRLLRGTTAPKITIAEGGDASGARGAALYAQMTRDTK